MLNNCNALRAISGQLKGKRYVNMVGQNILSEASKLFIYGFLSNVWTFENVIGTRANKVARLFEDGLRLVKNVDCKLYGNHWKKVV